MKIKSTILSLIILVNSTLLIGQITNGLVLNYNFDEDAIDQTSNGNDGTLINLADTSDHSGTSNSALYFNGTDGTIDLPNNGSIKPSLPLTLTANIKIDDLSSVRPIYHSDVYYNNYAGFWINVDVTGQIYVHISADLGSGSTNRRTFATTETLTVGTWQRVTVVINAYNDIQVYIDCALTSGSYSGSGSTTMAYTNNIGNIGQGAANAFTPYPYFFKGSMDEIGLWSRALNGNEITSVCNGALTLDKKEGKKFNLFPNPATSNFTLQLLTENNFNNLTYTLSDISGKVVTNDNISNANSKIEINDLSNGIYLISLFENDKIIGTERLIIE